MKKIGEQLQAWRGRQKLSQSQAAEALGVSVRTLQEWEQGRRIPRGLALTALIAKLKGKP